MEHPRRGIRRGIVVVAAVACCCWAPVSLASNDARSEIDRMLSALGGEERIAALDSLAVRAECSGPGGDFVTEVVSMAGDRTWFRQLSDRGTTELTRNGESGWGLDPSGERQPLTEEHLYFVAGHEFHMLVMQLGRRFSDHEVAGKDEIDGHPCTRLTMRDLHGQPASICIDDRTGLPLQLVQQPLPEFGEASIRIRFGDWESIDGIRYFRSFVMDHGEDRFTYDYVSIEPGGGDPALFASNGEDDADEWMATEAEDYVSANRGEITRPTKTERVDRIRPYLESTRFTAYRDLVPPVVRVSDDGTLGWVIAQVHVAGEQAGGGADPQEFDTVWAWIELYEKRDGRWLRIGNVSNRRPD